MTNSTGARRFIINATHLQDADSENVVSLPSGATDVVLVPNTTLDDGGISDGFSLANSAITWQASSFPTPAQFFIESGLVKGGTVVPADATIVNLNAIPGTLKAKLSLIAVF